MPEIGFSLQPQYRQPFAQVIALLKASGFSAVSPVWSPELDLDSLAACLEAHNMRFQSLHAPHWGISLLWNPDDPASADVRNNILRCIDACAQHQIPTMVIHGWQGLIYTFPSEPLNFSNFDCVVEHAREQGVCVAFENLEGEEYLEALMMRYLDQSHVGYCWDSGHDHCYPHATDFLEAYGDRLIMTHLNDNLGLRDLSGIPSGDDDLHFLPYDGNIDWNHAISRLKNKPQQATLNFEIKLRYQAPSSEDLIYSQLSLKQFLNIAGERARRIAALYEKITAENES